MKLGVRSHVRELGHPVREIEEGGDGADVPDFAPSEPVGLQLREVLGFDAPGSLGQLHREIQHGAVTVVDVRRAMVRNQLVREEGILPVDPNERPVGNVAVVAVVGPADRHNDHFDLQSRQLGMLDEGVVVLEERPEVRRSIPVGEEHVRGKPRSFGLVFDALAEVLGEVLLGRDRKPRHRLDVGHGWRLNRDDHKFRRTTGFEPLDSERAVHRRHDHTYASSRLGESMDGSIDFGGHDRGRGMSYWAIDPVLGRAVERSLADFPATERQLSLAKLAAFGEVVGTEIAPNADVVDRHPPTLHTHDRDGELQNRVEYHPLQHENERLAYGAGIVHDVFETPTLERPDTERAFPEPDGPLPFLHNLAMEYLLSAADAGFTCPVAMTAGVARVLEEFGPESERPAVMEDAYRRLIATERDRLAEGAMFLTERAGGSDVGGGTETVARRGEDGTWRLTGEKWFCSNLDADAKLVLARRPEAPTGTDGLSLFLVPHEVDGRPNDLRCRRLKDKLGTLSVPTGEVELEGAVGYLVGEPERGFKYMTEMLNLERLSNAAAACGLMSRALLEATIHAANREAFGRPLHDHPLMARDLLDLRVDHEAATAFTMEAARVYSVRERARRAGDRDEEAYRLMRILVPIAKLRTGRMAVDTTSYAMEILGGNGYVADFVTHRLLRDAQVLPIWEGTTNVLSLDVLRALAREAAHQPLFEAIDERLDALTANPVCELEPPVRAARSALASDVDALATVEESVAQLHAKRFANDVFDVTTATLLLAAGDRRLREADDARELLVARRFIDRHLGEGVGTVRDGNRFALEHFDAIVHFETCSPDRLE